MEIEPIDIQNDDQEFAEIGGMVLASNRSDFKKLKSRKSS